jgi:16S rRNA G1207 methylase RsmC
LERFGLAMKANSLNSLRGVLEKCDFTGVGLVADIAGGFGHLVIALLQKYPNLKGVLTDLPELIPVSKAKNPVSDPAVASRLEYVGANMFDGVPPANA